MDEPDKIQKAIDDAVNCDEQRRLESLVALQEFSSSDLLRVIGRNFESQDGLRRYVCAMAMGVCFDANFLHVTAVQERPYREVDIEELGRVFGSMLQSESSEIVIARIIKSIRQCCVNISLDEYANSPSIDVRLEFVFSLVPIGDSQEKLLYAVEFAEDSMAELRQASAIVFGEETAASFRAKVRNSLRNLSQDTDDAVRHSAIRSLVEIGELDVASCLSDELRKYQVPDDLLYAVDELFYRSTRA